ncbi:hypothetical protein ISN44_Un124g000010, partial [Arabidopsis suecica]
RDNIDRIHRELRKQQATSNPVVVANEANANELPGNIGAGDAPRNHHQRAGIVPPPIQNNNFEIKSGLISMNQGNKFHGLPMEDPLDHLDNFDRLCSLTKINGVSEDSFKLRLFPFSLGDKAHFWEKTLRIESIDTWDDCKKAFLAKFFSNSRTARLRNEISGFNQKNSESFSEAWERFKGYTTQCPHHGFKKASLLSTLYKGALPKIRMLLDTASNGNFLNKDVAEGWELIENLAQSDGNYNEDYDRSNRGSNDSEDKHKKEIKALNDKIDNMVLAQQRNVHYILEEELTQLQDGESLTIKEVSYLQNQGGYNKGFNNYKPPHPNLSYRSNNVTNPEDQVYPQQNQQTQAFVPYNQGYNQKQNFGPPGFTPQPHTTSAQDSEMKTLLQQLVPGQASCTMTMDKKLAELTTRIDCSYNDLKIKIDALNTRVKSMEGHIASTSAPKHPGQLPGKAVQNPKEYAHAISTVHTSDTEDSEIQEGEKMMFIKCIKELEEKVPLVDTPKEVIMERPQEAQEIVELSFECSAIIKRKVILKKLDDLGSFTLPCSLGPLVFNKSLCDLGASVSLMCLSFAKRLGFDKFKPSSIHLILADRSVRVPHGMLEDLLAKIGSVEIPTDFVVQEMDEELKDPLIFERPFLATAGALIDVQMGKIDLNLRKNLQMSFDISKKMKKLTIEGQRFFIEEGNLDAELLSGLENFIPNSIPTHHLRETKQPKEPSMIKGEPRSGVETEKNPLDVGSIARELMELRREYGAQEDTIEKLDLKMEELNHTILALKEMIKGYPSLEIEEYFEEPDLGEEDYTTDEKEAYFEERSNEYSTLQLTRENAKKKKTSRNFSATLDRTTRLQAELLHFKNMDPEESRQRASARAVARGFAMINEKDPVWNQDASSVGRSTAAREEIARGKRVWEVEPTAIEEEHVLEREASEEDVEIAEEVLPVPARRRRNNPRKKKEPTIEEHYQYLMELSFEGTRSPHRPTMQALGICRDVEYLMEMAKLETFFSYKCEGYKEESCLFLATLKLHFYADEREKELHKGVGYITFMVYGIHYSLAIRQVDALFKFPTYFREYATGIHQSGFGDSLCAGGVITPILIAAGVPLHTPTVTANYIDIEHLKKKGFLDRSAPAKQLQFKFKHSKLGLSRLALPCKEYTTVRTGNNIDFDPPPSILVNVHVPFHEEPSIGSESQEEGVEFNQAEAEQEEHTRPSTFRQAEYGQAEYDQSVYSRAEQFDEHEDSCEAAAEQEVPEKVDQWVEKEGEKDEEANEWYGGLDSGAAKKAEIATTSTRVQEKQLDECGAKKERSFRPAKSLILRAREELHLLRLPFHRTPTRSSELVGFECRPEPSGVILGLHARSVNRV